MTITTTAAPSAQKAVTDDAATDLANRRLSIAFINWAHAIDHFVILIYPTVVIALQAIYGDSYSTLIYLATASFVAFGLFSLPAGWLGDHWSRRNMMTVFYFGCRPVADRRGVVAVAVRARCCAVRARRLCGDLSSGRYRDDRRSGDPARPHARLQRRLRQSRRVACRGHHRGADGAVLLARRFRRAGRDLHHDRFRLYVVRAQGKPARGVALEVARRGDVDDACRCDLRAVPPRRGQRRARLQHYLGGAAGDRPRAHHRHFSDRGRRSDHRGVPVRRRRAAHGRPAGRAFPAAYPVCDPRHHAVFRRGVVGLCRRRDAAVRARLHHGGDLWPDHRQRPDPRPLQRRRLARPPLCGALLRDVHDFGRRGVDDRVPACPRRLRPGARRHRGRCARLPDRRDRDRRSSPMAWKRRGRRRCSRRSEFRRRLSFSPLHISARPARASDTPRTGAALSAARPTAPRSHRRRRPSRGW